MSHREFGGNIIDELSLDQPGKQVFGSGPYEYCLYQTTEREDVTFNSLRSFSVYLFKMSPGANVRAEGVDEALEQGDCIQAEDRMVRLRVLRGPAQMLVAGTREPHPEVQGLFLNRHADLYKVVKPWGHELWINGQHPRYAFKQIFIEAGTRTSLQYHTFKQETNVLFKGTAKLHYKVTATVPNDSVTPADLATVQIEPVRSIGVTPPTLHRLEAVTDILLYEVSTPHLDDVVRVLDDSSRSHGRIETEHSR